MTVSKEELQDIREQIKGIEVMISNLSKLIGGVELQKEASQPTFNDQRIQAIVSSVGKLLIDRSWRHRSIGVHPCSQIAEAFAIAWDNKNSSDLQCLVAGVGQQLMIVDTMPSYSTIQDWIVAFERFSVNTVELIGKSAAAILAKRNAPQSIIDLVIARAFVGEPICDKAIKDKIARQASPPGDE